MVSAVAGRPVGPELVVPRLLVGAFAVVAAGKKSGLSVAALISLSAVARAKAMASRLAPWTAGAQRSE